MAVRDVNYILFIKNVEISFKNSNFSFITNIWETERETEWERENIIS